MKNPRVFHLITDHVRDLCEALECEGLWLDEESLVSKKRLKADLERALVCALLDNEGLDDASVAYLKERFPSPQQPDPS